MKKTAARPRRPGERPPEPNLYITDKCNRTCLFCGARGERRLRTRVEMRANLGRGFESIIMEGGEPLLDPGLAGWARLAKEKGVKDISVLTNGTLLDAARLAELRAAGVDHFHFNFPSHLEKLFDLLTGTSGQLKALIAAIRSAAASGPRAAVLICVMNSANMRTLPDYADFAASGLGGVFYLALNFVKQSGLVKRRTWLVPRYGGLEPYLLETLKRAKRRRLPVLVDGVPLCFMKGFEAYSRDAGRILMGDDTYLREKAPVRACLTCSLNALCPGPRKDYVRLHGDGEFKPSRRSAARIRALIGRGQLSLNS